MSSIGQESQEGKISSSSAFLPRKLSKGNWFLSMNHVLKINLFFLLLVCTVREISEFNGNIFFSFVFQLSLLFVDYKVIKGDITHFKILKKVFNHQSGYLSK